VTIKFEGPFAADVVVHTHPPAGEALKSTSLGDLRRDRVVLPAALLVGKTEISIEIT
jgi:hypothetical protein